MGRWVGLAAAGPQQDVAAPLGVQHEREVLPGHGRMQHRSNKRLSDHGRGRPPGKRRGIRIIDRRGTDALESNMRLGSEAFSNTGGEAANPVLDLVANT